MWSQLLKVEQEVETGSYKERFPAVRVDTILLFFAKVRVIHDHKIYSMSVGSLNNQITLNNS